MKVAILSNFRQILLSSKVYKMIYIIQFMALMLLILVTGIFWGPWFALHRSMKVFNKEEFIHIVKTMSANLAVPMRIMMPSCLLLMLLTVGTYPQQHALGFYLNIMAFMLMIIVLIITISVEVPIVKQIEQWTAITVPHNMEAMQNRWLKFHVIRTFFAITSCAIFIASILLLR